MKKIIIFNLTQQWISKIHRISCISSAITATITLAIVPTTNNSSIPNKFWVKMLDLWKKRRNFKIESKKSKTEISSLFRPWNKWKRSLEDTERDDTQKSVSSLRPSINVNIRNAKSHIVLKLLLRTTWNENMDEEDQNTIETKTSLMINELLFYFSLAKICRQIFNNIFIIMIRFRIKSI